MIQNPISKSTPSNNLKFYSDVGEVQVEVLINFLDISRAVLAQALGFPPDALRQERLTGRALDRVTELASAIEYVSETFDGNLKQTLYWIKTPNLNFGGFSPRQLILNGKYKKVRDFILDARTSK